tara:strand:- start:143 stop:379 length:237 start_codon:yes stop_codon:yes gene_type:complete
MIAYQNIWMIHEDETGRNVMTLVITDRKGQWVYDYREHKIKRAKDSIEIDIPTSVRVVTTHTTDKRALMNVQEVGDYT